MIPNTSSILRKLSLDEISILREELKTNEGLWMKHPMNFNSLDKGQSIIINWVTRINRLYQLQWTFREKFPNTWKILDSLCGDRQLGKVYWHLLKPSVHAKPHIDSRNPYIADGNAYKRYDIFLNIPNNLEFFIDDNIVPVANSIIEYSIFDLAANRLHSVQNNTEENFYVLVVDILNKDVPVYSDLYHINEPNFIGLQRLTNVLIHE